MADGTPRHVTHGGAAINPARKEPVKQELADLVSQLSPVDATISLHVPLGIPLESIYGTGEKLAATTGLRVVIDREHGLDAPKEILKPVFVFSPEAKAAQNPFENPNKEGFVGFLETCLATDWKRILAEKAGTPLEAVYGSIVDYHFGMSFTPRAFNGVDVKSAVFDGIDAVYFLVPEAGRPMFMEAIVEVSKLRTDLKEDFNRLVARIKAEEAEVSAPQTR
jgi:hypothetical protein